MLRSLAAGLARKVLEAAPDAHTRRGFALKPERSQRTGHSRRPVARPSARVSRGHRGAITQGWQGDAVFGHVASSQASLLAIMALSLGLLGGCAEDTLQPSRSPSDPTNPTAPEAPLPPRSSTLDQGTAPVFVPPATGGGHHHHGHGGAMMDHDGHGAPAGAGHGDHAPDAGPAPSSKPAPTGPTKSTP